jgi:hypothetical protein
VKDMKKGEIELDTAIFYAIIIIVGFAAFTFAYSVFYSFNHDTSNPFSPSFNYSNTNCSKGQVYAFNLSFAGCITTPKQK